MYFSKIESISKSMIFLRNPTYLWFGVRMTLNLFRSLSRSGCCERKYKASASKTRSEPSGRFLTRIGKNLFIYWSRPRPGPMTQDLIANFHFKIYSNHYLCTRSSYSSLSLTSEDETKTGCTMISGEYDFIAVAALFGQKIWAKSPPTLSDVMAE